MLRLWLGSHTLILNPASSLLKLLVFSKDDKLPTQRDHLQATFTLLQDGGLHIALQTFQALFQLCLWILSHQGSYAAMPIVQGNTETNISHEFVADSVQSVSKYLLRTSKDCSMSTLSNLKQSMNAWYMNQQKSRILCGCWLLFTSPRYNLLGCLCGPRRHIGQAFLPKVRWSKWGLGLWFCVELPNHLAI